MPRHMKAGNLTQFRVWITVRWSGGVENTSYYGPYSTQSGAQGQLTSLIKDIDRYSNGTEFVACGMDTAEIIWNPVKTAYERKLEKATEKFWKEVGDLD